MEKLPTPPKPSRVTVPRRAHPAAKLVFHELARQRMTYDELEHRSGVLKSTFKAWRTHNAPSLTSLAATLGALGWSFIPVPDHDDVLKPAVRAKLAELARDYGLDEDGVLAHFIREIAHLPLETVDARYEAVRAA